MGHLRATVNIPKDHVLFTVDPQDEAVLEKLKAHRGVNAIIFESDKSRWASFDAAHRGDLTPYTFVSPTDTYRDMEYMTKEAEKLVDQLIDYT
jgi:hypothetical protein